MTIAAQHLRSALNHLRGSDPRWRQIVREVGPCLVRLERRPDVWLVANLECRTFLDHAAVADGALGPGSAPSTVALGLGSGQSLLARTVTAKQQEFAQGLQFRLDSGRLELRLPVNSDVRAEQAAGVADLLADFHSTILSRFLFYCWGDLDSWPSEDSALDEVVQRLWRGTDDSPPNKLPSLDELLALRSKRVPSPIELVERTSPDRARTLVDRWRPYRSIAAWYLERLALRVWSPTGHRPDLG